MLTGEIVDHFGGQEDLKRGIVSHVNDASFAEDPLRVLRAAQFAARFGFSVAEETLSLCARMDLTNLAGERILVEASPYDGIWGVKLGIEDPKIQNPNN